MVRLTEMTEPLVIDHGSSRPGRWLRQRRTTMALWIAVAEAIVVWLSKGLHIWVVISICLLAALAFAGYSYVSQRTGSDLLHQLAWIGATSQVLAAVAVVLAYVVLGILFVVIAIFIVVALALLLLDRR